MIPWWKVLKTGGMWHSFLWQLNNKTSSSPPSLPLSFFSYFLLFLPRLFFLFFLSFSFFNSYFYSFLYHSLPLPGKPPNRQSCWILWHFVLCSHPRQDHSRADVRCLTAPLSHCHMPKPLLHFTKSILNYFSYQKYPSILKIFRNLAVVYVFLLLILEDLRVFSIADFGQLVLVYNTPPGKFLNLI